MTQLTSVLVLDDDESFFLELEMALASESISLTTVTSVDQFNTYLYSTLPDLVLLNLYIDKQLVGFDLAEKVAKRNIPIIFVTTYTDPNLLNQALQFQPHSFLVKPIKKINLIATLRIILKQKKDLNNLNHTHFTMDIKFNLYIRTNNRLDRIDTREVAYVLNEGNYCTIYLDNKKKHIVKTSLLQLKSKYFADIMVRAHRNYLVHLAKIESINLSDKWLLVNGEQIPIGRSYQSELLDKLTTIK